jgi:hypothetical protein
MGSGTCLIAREVNSSRHKGFSYLWLVIAIDYFLWKRSQIRDMLNTIEAFLQNIASSSVIPGCTTDWLIHTPTEIARVTRIPNKPEICLHNGLISRTFRLSPNGSTVDFENLMTGTSLIRGIKPEAKITLDGREYEVGGLHGQIEYGYLLPEWLDRMTTAATDYQLVSITSGPILARFPWKSKRYATNTVWPPKGCMLSFFYKKSQTPDSSLPDVEIGVHYALYDTIPCLEKWITIKNLDQKTIRLDRFTAEILAMVEAESVPQGDPAKGVAYPAIHMESDYIFAAMSPQTANVTTLWTKDPQYTSQVAYLSDALVQLESKPPIGPAIDLQPGEIFESYRTFELVFDSTDRQRRGLSLCRMYRTIAPWITENPIFMHCVSANPIYVKNAVDQCAELGFEMVILSFGCGIDMEWEEAEFYEEFKEVFDYAHTKGIEIGTYSLFSSRSIGSETDVVDPKSGDLNKHATFGKAPCLASAWGKEYIRKLKRFITETGADFIEHDGPYPGDLCASTKHNGHRDVNDSQWQQWILQRDFYRWCCANGIFINAPDWYFLNGSNKTGMGYKEVNWSLPRERQVILARQNIYDGTWEKAPSMGWMFTPLTVYHMVGDWKLSTLEPLDEHLMFYEAHLRQNFSAGVQSCYRGMKLYDTEKTKAVVKKWVDFYKSHRTILDSDIVHIRRPDGRHIDGIMHVNSSLKEKGLLVLFNPLGETVHEKMKISVYYTGLENSVLISKMDGKPMPLSINRDFSIDLDVDIPAYGMVWYILQ